MTRYWSNTNHRTHVSRRLHRVHYQPFLLLALQNQHFQSDLVKPESRGRSSLPQDRLSLICLCSCVIVVTLETFPVLVLSFSNTNVFFCFDSCWLNSERHIQPPRGTGLINPPVTGSHVSPNPPNTTSTSQRLVLECEAATFLLMQRLNEFQRVNTTDTTPRAHWCHRRRFSRLINHLLVWLSWEDLSENLRH